MVEQFFYTLIIPDKVFKDLGSPSQSAGQETQPPPSSPIPQEKIPPSQSSTAGLQDFQEPYLLKNPIAPRRPPKDGLQFQDRIRHAVDPNTGYHFMEIGTGGWCIVFGNRPTPVTTKEEKEALRRALISDLHS